MRVDAYSAEKATAKPQASHPSARRQPRSRPARTRNTIRKTQNVERWAIVPRVESASRPDHRPWSRLNETRENFQRGTVPESSLCYYRAMRATVVQESRVTPPTIVQSEVDTAIERAQPLCSAAQAPDGHWVGRARGQQHDHQRVPAPLSPDRPGGPRPGSQDGALPARAAASRRRLEPLRGRARQHLGHHQGLLRHEGGRRGAGRPRDGAGAGAASATGAVPSRPTSSPRSCWRSSASTTGAVCRPCRSRSCCCRAGPTSTCSRSRTGRGRSSCPLLVLWTPSR